MPTSRPADPDPPLRPSQPARLETARGEFAALSWPHAGGPRVLALHGWLDNAASFVPLAPHLAGVDLVAVDLAGHGHSGHRPAGAQYYFPEYVFDLDLILDAIGWERCHLLGHSMGAAISSLYAAAAPERVESLVMLDTLGPLTGDPEDAADRLRRSMQAQRRVSRGPKPYPSIEAMVEARLANSHDLSAESARLICERAARRDGEHCFWRTDPRLNWVSPSLMSEEQALDCLRHIQAPTLSLTAQPFARWAGENTVRRRTAAIAHGVHETIEGGHHFHMDQPARVGARILAFLRAHDDRQGISA